MILYARQPNKAAAKAINRPLPVAVSPHIVVKAKRSWYDDWTVLPNVFCIDASHVRDAEGSQAVFEYHVDAVGQPGGVILSSMTGPLWPSGCYIAVDAVWPNGQVENKWLGVVKDEVIHPEGRTDLQAFRAVGLLEDTLSKMYCGGAVVAGWPAAGFDMYPLVPFRTYADVTVNDQLGHVRRWNFTEQTVGLVSRPMFGLWPLVNVGPATNLDVLRYIVAYELNREADGGNPPIQFDIAGPALAMLDTIVDKHQLKGKSVLEALRTVIDARRGFGFTYYTDGLPGSVVYIIVFNVLASHNTQIVNIAQRDPYYSATIHIDTSRGYDGVLALGSMIKHVGSYSYSAPYANLVEGWTQADRGIYDGIDSSYANPDALQSDMRRQWRDNGGVYSFHKVKPLGRPNAWIPAPGCEFHSVIPRLTGDPTNWNAGNELATEKHAFAVLPTLIPRINKMGYLAIDELDIANLPGAGMRFDCDSLAMWLQSTMPHVMAKGISPEPILTGAPPRWSYRDLIITAMADTHMQFARMFATGAYGWSTVPRIKRIEDETASIIVSSPNTVYGVRRDNPTILDYYPEITPSQDVSGCYVILDTTFPLLQKAALAAQWYAQAGATCDILEYGISSRLGIGTLIGGIWTQYGWTQAGTPVHSVTWDFRNVTTRVISDMGAI